MELYLARAIDTRVIAGGGYDCLADKRPVSILESYYTIQNNKYFPSIYKSMDSLDVMLDSGAYTFMASRKRMTDWDRYIEEYAAFINKYDIRLFFELDIDSIIGLKEVERLRTRLEYLTGKKCIPVWHKSRGKQYFLDMCSEYKYVALGGLVTKEIKKEEYRFFPWFIQTAHEKKCKIHGLGFTRLAMLRDYHFDSVDSTAWVYGNRAGYIYRFDPRLPTLMAKIDVPQGKRLKAQEAAMHNFQEWIKLQKWARINL